MIKNILKLGGFTFLGLFISSSLSADIYKCTSLEGKTFYNDKPCHGQEQLEQKMESIKDPEAMTTFPVSTPKILEPEDEEVIGDGEEESDTQEAQGKWFFPKESEKES